MKQPGALTLLAPLAGWSTPLDEAPDEVFAARLLGDGLAIDPTGATLHAPCDGEIVLLPASRHAVTLRTGSGCEILLHVGIDTVALAGDGFEAHVHRARACARAMRSSASISTSSRGARRASSPRSSLRPRAAVVSAGEASIARLQSANG
ncbi:MAG TPA: PTS glucose transporter subunit IIA [Steroidobacteraceae bacterium]|nr:PTS glucose transporter subunit IIA [Steroidobacteraceae bacterium]